MLIRARNNLDQIAEPTYISSLTSSGAGTIGVKNVNSFYANWAIQVGKTDEEQTEIKLVTGSTPSGTSLVITGTTNYDHPSDTPIYPVKYDQVVFKRSTSGTAGTATALANGTVNITPDSLYTLFDDTSGASTYAYKYAFYNSVIGTASSDSDWITPQGLSFYCLAKMRQRVKAKLFDSGYIKNDSDIDDWINEWQESMTNAAIDNNEDYSMGTVDVAFAAGTGSGGNPGLGTITTADFKQVRRIWVTTDGVNYYQAAQMEANDFYPNQTFNSTQPRFYMQGDNVIGIKPDDSAGTARIAYYKLQTALVNDTDELPLSMRGYTKSFVNYGLSQAYYKDGKKDEGDGEMQLAIAERKLFISEISPRHKTGPTYIDLIESVSGDDFGGGFGGL